MTSASLGALTWVFTGAIALAIAQAIGLGEPGVGALSAGLGLMLAGAWLGSTGALRRAGWASGLGFALAGLALAAIVYVVAAPSGLHYDSLLYHLSAIRWLRDGPIPEGLALLHSRLGIASTQFALSALFTGDARPELQPTTALLVGALLVEFARRARISAEPALWGWATLAVVVSGRPFGVDGASPGTDLPSALAVLYATLLWIERARDPERGPRASEILLALSAAAWVKASALPLAAAGALALALPLAREARTRAGAFRVVVITLGWAAWLAASWRLSGCLAYPAGAFCADAPWAARAEDAARLRELITGWARQPGGDPAAVFRAWFPSWFVNTFWRYAEVKAAFVALLLAAVAVARDAGARAAWRDARPILVAHGLALGVWFAQAPDPRFALGTWLALAIWGAWVATRRRAPSGRSLAGLAAVGLGIRLVVGVVGNGASPPPVAEAPVRVWVSAASGQSFFTPREGDQCGWGPLLCTPETRPDLRVEGAGGGRLRFTR